MDVAQVVYPTDSFDTVCTRCNSGRDEDKIYTEVFEQACQTKLGEMDFEAIPDSEVANDTAIGHMVFQDLGLLLDSDVLRLFGKTAKQLKLKPLSFKLEGPSNPSSNLFAVSMTGFPLEEILTMRKARVYHDVRVTWEEGFLRPGKQLVQAQGANTFSYIADNHMAARPPALKLSGRPPSWLELRKKIDEIEAAEAEVGDGDAAGNPDESESSEAEDAEGEDALPERTRPRAPVKFGLGSMVEPKAKAKAKAKAKTLPAPVAAAPSAAALPSSGAAQSAPGTGGGEDFSTPPRASSPSTTSRTGCAGGGGKASKRDREIEQCLDEMTNDNEMLDVAKKHFATDSGSSIKCLVQLKPDVFLCQGRQGHTLMGVLASEHPSKNPVMIHAMASTARQNSKISYCLHIEQPSICHCHSHGHGSKMLSEVINSKYNLIKL